MERKMPPPRPRRPKPRFLLPKPRLRPNPRLRPKPPMPTRANVECAAMGSPPATRSAPTAAGATTSKPRQAINTGARAFTTPFVPEARRPQTAREGQLAAQGARHRDRYVRADRGRDGKHGCEEDEHA